jgi:CheY-like chemotaxis protein
MVFSLASKSKILHIDDNKDHLSLTKIYLIGDDPSLIIDSTDSVTESLKMIQEKDYECIVIDYSMPDMNGLELAKKIKEIKDIPIILYTGKGNEKILEAGYKIGIEDYVEKLLNLNHYNILSKKILNAIKKHSQLNELKSELNFLKNFLDLSNNQYFILGTDYSISWTNIDLSGKKTNNFIELYPELSDIIINNKDKSSLKKNVFLNEEKHIIHISKMKDGIKISLIKNTQS